MKHVGLIPSQKEAEGKDENMVEAAASKQNMNNFKAMEE